MKTRLKDKISRWLSVVASIGLAASACADNAAVTVTVDGTSVTASNASAENYDNYTWHKSNYIALKLNIPASSDLAADTYLRLTSLSIGAQNGGSGNYNNQVKYVTVTGVDGFAYKSEVISTTTDGFSSTAATPETSNKQTFSFANPWCFVQVGMDYTVELLDADGNAVAGLSSRCVEYTDSVLSNWNGAQWTPLAELTAEIVTPTTPAAVDEAGDYTIALDGLATYPSISVAGNLTITGSGTLVVTGAFTLGGTLTVDSTVNLAFTTTTDTIQFPVGAAFAGLNIADVSKLYVTGGVTTDGTAFSWTKGTIPAPADNYIKTDTKSTGNTSTRVSRVTTETGYAYIGGWQLYWAGADGAYWNNKANWRYADGTTPTGYPNNIDSPGDHCYFSNEASITACNAQITVAHITLNADVTFIGPATGAKPLYCCLFDGTGKMRLSNATIGACEKTTGCTINNNVEVVARTTNTLNCKWGNNKIYSFTLNGKLTGSGKLICAHGSAADTGIKFYGSNLDFAGEYEDTGIFGRGGTDFSSWQCSSSNAVWNLQANKKNNTDSIIFNNDSDTYYFGAIIGNGQGGYYNPKVEIGHRFDVDSDFQMVGRSDRNGVWTKYTITKVGSGYAKLTSNGSAFGTLYLKGGTAYCELLPTSALSFLEEGGTVSFKATPVEDSETGEITSITTLDPSSVIKDSTAPISFDDLGTNVTWGTALASSNTGGLTKKGAGTLTLSAVPLYSGATRVEEGTLVVPLGTSLGDVYVAEGATLTVDLTGATSSSAFLTCASMENNGTVNWINTPDGITPQAVETDGKYFIAVPRTLTWSGAGDDTAWTTAGNWLVGEDAATLAPQPFDSVLFNTTTPGVTLSAAAEVASVTAPDGFVLNTTYDLTVLGNMTVDGSMTKSGNGALLVGGTLTANTVTISKGEIDATSYVVTSFLMPQTQVSGDQVVAAREWNSKVTIPSSRTWTDVNNYGSISATGTQEFTATSASVFAGNLSGDMNFVKSGTGTLTLFGTNAFTGSVAINAGRLCLGSYKNISGLVSDYDAENTDSFKYKDDDSSQGVSQWKSSAGTGSAYLSPDSSASYPLVVVDNSILNGHQALSSDAFDMWQSEAVNTEGQTSVFVYQPLTGWRGGVAHDNETGAGAANPYRWRLENKNGYIRDTENTKTQTVPLWNNGKLMGYDDASSLSPTISVLARRLVRYNSGILGLGYNKADAVGDSIAFGQALFYNRYLSVEEAKAIEAQLMAKWGINNATYAALPATADVSVSAGATLDLGGLTQTVASLDLAGTIQNGTLVVTGNNLAIAPATAAISATIMVSGYDSSMTAPAGFSFTDNGDGTATLVDNRATATLTWTATESGGNWSDAANWNLGYAPGWQNTVVFPAGEYTVTFSNRNSSGDACWDVTINGDVTFARNVWSYLDVHQNIGGTGTLTLTNMGINNCLDNTLLTISCGLKINNSQNANEDSYFIGWNGTTFAVTGEFEASGKVNFFKSVSISGLLTLDNGVQLAAGDDTTAQIANILVPSGAAATMSGTLTLAGTVTLEGADSTLTVPANANVSGATFVCGVSGYDVELDGSTYKAVLATVVTPGTPVSVDSEEAAAAYTVVLTATQETQGLQTSYYTTEVTYNSETQKYVVTAELAESVKPKVDAGVAVSGTTVTLPATNLKKGLCYRVVTTDANGTETVGSWSEYYDGVNAPSLTATLPESGVLYYAIEASDAK